MDRKEGVWTVIRAIHGFYIRDLFILWPAPKWSAASEENSNLTEMGSVKQT